MHPICINPSSCLLRAFGGVPSQIPLGGQGTRQWRRQHPFIPKPRPKSSNENDGPGRSNPPKLVPNHVLCLETLPKFERYKNSKGTNTKKSTHSKLTFLILTFLTHPKTLPTETFRTEKIQFYKLFFRKKKATKIFRQKIPQNYKFFQPKFEIRINKYQETTVQICSKIQQYLQ